MNSPLISICLPNLNTRPYLEERVATIFAQTYANWELIVSDNFSTDGSWEFFESLAGKDSRVSISQAPKEGLYANWNNCLQRARGEYVYIATSDDTMAEDCLAKLASALDRHPDVDIAHCALRTIGPHGGPVSDPTWPDCTVFAHGTEEFLRQRHLRKAPFDGLLHLTGRSVYCSITELMIRRTLFDRIGYFRPKWGSIGDFNWNMRASLVANTLHVPDTWATYRVHPTQATASVRFHSEEYAHRIEEMIDDAIATSGPLMPRPILEEVTSHWLPLGRQMRLYYAQLRNRRNAANRRLFQARALIAGPSAIRREVASRLVGGPKWPEALPAQIRKWLEAAGMQPVVRAD